eukprot:jgi/Tetstr1/463969/TSEL_008774.t1
MDSLQSLRAFLKSSYPNDVLMPVRPRGKAPMFSFKVGAWGWSDWDAYCSKLANRAPDVCVILRDLCVIDVDSQEAALELRSAFPVLDDAPCERTTRGFHFFFERSGFADDGRFFTCHSAVRVGVDFKSIAATGTGGVIVVAPSTGKSWIRPLMTHQLMPIPDDLLAAVAAPRDPPFDLEIACTDGSLAVQSPWLRRMEYFSPWVEGDLSQPALAPVTAAQARLLFAVLEGSALPSPPTDDMFESVRHAADILGAPSAALERRLGSERMVRERHAHALSADLWAALSDASLHDLSGGVRYSPARHVDGADYLWARHGPRGLSSPWAVAPDPASRALSRLPSAVAAFMRKHRESVVLAGGFVAGQVCELSPAWGDIDLFVHSCTGPEAMALEESFRDMLMVVHASSMAVTASVPRAELDGGGEVTAQLVRRIYADAASVVGAFDIPACKALLRFDRDDRLIAEGTADFVHCVSTMSFLVDFGKWGRGSVARVFKYVAKGFDAIAPGLDRRKALAARFDRRRDMGTATALLFAERDLVRELGPAPPHPQDRQVGRVLKVCSRWCDMQCGYGDMGYFGRLVHAIRALVLRFFGERCDQPAAGEWKRVRPGGGMLSPLSPGVRRVRS